MNINDRDINIMAHKYTELTDDIELKLDESDKEAALTGIRYAHEEVSSRARSRINDRR